MIGFVSFDFFSPTDYIDLGFTDMPFWSENFKWLGYTSINFVENMGGILFFCFFQLILGPIVFCCCSHIKKRIKNRFLTKYFNPKSFMSILSKFLDGVFFEILVSVSCSMAMIKYSTYLNLSDQISVALSFLFATILLS